jgi:ketosteroid isomerase-like protein
MAADTSQVLKHHLEAFGAQDIEAIMEDYTADAVLITPMGTMRGHAEIRAAFVGFWADIFAAVESFELTCEAVEGEVAYIVWSCESGTHSLPVGTDTFVIRDGKIVAQTFAGHIIEKS